jgi:hypothetical protein
MPSEESALGYGDGLAPADILTWKDPSLKIDYQVFVRLLSLRKRLSSVWLKKWLIFDGQVRMEWNFWFSLVDATW